MLTHHQIENYDKKAKAQVILTFLLSPVLAGPPYFCLVTALNLTVSLAIDKVVLTGREVAAGLLGFFW